MAEFTGERIVPGLVEADLWNEHVSRYCFAEQYAAGKAVLDAGCGTGYGSQRIARVAASVTALDISPEALSEAAGRYRERNSTFVCGSCSILPFRSAAFDVAVSFEVIEHLEDWNAFLHDLRRVLTPDGVLIISTPNREYYSESRSESGPNPFHVHEFDHSEFDAALRALFPDVHLLTQNHADGIVFQPVERCGQAASLATENPSLDIESANFFLAVCRLKPGPPPPPFVFLPSAANVLRERERHIAMLSADVAELRFQKQNLVEMFRIQGQELEKSNRWAEELDADLTETRARIAAVQDELAAAQRTAAEHIARLEAEKARTAEGYEREIARLQAASADASAAYEAEIARIDRELRAELARAVALLDAAEARVVERTKWARRLEATLEEVRASRWVKLGNKFGVGPLTDEQPQ